MPVKPFLGIAVFLALAGCDDAYQPVLQQYRAGSVAASACAGQDQLVLTGRTPAPFGLCADPGTNVTWVVRSGAAKLRKVSSTTDGTGHAYATAVPVQVAQTIVVEARTAQDTVVFSARITDGTDIVLDTIRTGLSRPIYLAAPQGDPRLFIVEQPGRIRIIKNGTLLPTPFLDIRSLVDFDGPKGLFSVAFHPQYATTGFFFVNYRSLDGNSLTVRYRANPASDQADPASAKLIMSVPQTNENHSGGHMLFGPDGRLYIAMGDGGPGGDPNGHAQDLTTLKGDLLRINIDVSETRAYSSPRGNPYFDDPPNRPEIFMSGLRHPWRIAFDNGYLYIPDVGQSQREEINIVRANAGGLNFGWPVMEGTACYDAVTCNSSGFTPPVLEYDHSVGCSITAGFVYRGTELPELAGTYFYSDYCSGWIRSFRYNNGQILEQREWTHLGTLTDINSFGVDGMGELYVISRQGVLMRFTRAE